MKFVYPTFGLILGFLCLEVLFTLYTGRRKGHQLRKKWGSTFLYHPSRKQNFRLRVRNLCLWIGIPCFCIAAARPQWGSYLEKHKYVGTNVLFAIDTSKSMLATDVRPNRLELAKISILELLKSIRGSHVGLIAFAGSAFLQCPSTNDMGAFKAALDILDTRTITYGGTNLSAAMGIALETFEQTSKNKHIILFTDGENLAGDTLKMAKVLAEKGIVVHTVGIGTPKGCPICIQTPQGTTEYVKDSNGETVITKLDEKTLQEIARITKGFYAPLGNAGEGLQQIYQMALKNLPKENFESLEKIPIERYVWFLGIAFILLALEPLFYSWKALRKGTK